jgi:hypothetical protein
MKKFILIAIMILAFVFPAGADVLRWDASDRADGYIVYWGTVEGSYPNHTDVGNVLEVGTSGQGGALAEYFFLSPGTTFFTVTAYNIMGESGNGNVVNLVIEEYTPPEDVFPIKITVPATVTITITND